MSCPNRFERFTEPKSMLFGRKYKNKSLE